MSGFWTKQVLNLPRDQHRFQFLGSPASDAGATGNRSPLCRRSASSPPRSRRVTCGKLLETRVRSPWPPPLPSEKVALPCIHPPTGAR
eukprot:14827106-Heterocapsa_arctica.AAC.1